MVWHKLLARQGVDITTVSLVDFAFLEAISEFTEKKEESFFTISEGKNFTHYINVDSKELGLFIYNKYLNTKEKIEKYYEKAISFIKEIEKRAKKWEAKLNKNNSSSNLLEAFKEREEDFKKIGYLYSIYPYLAIEAWQSEFEKMLNDIIKREKLEDKQDIIMSSVYKPWKKTALLEIQEKIKKNINAEKIAEEYQFLRSWSAVWYSPIEASWIKSLTPKGKEEKDRLSEEELIKLMKPNKKEEEYLRISSHITFFKDFRDDIRRKECFLWSFIFDKIAERYNLKHDDLGYLSFEEIRKGLKEDNIDVSKIDKRKKAISITTCKENQTETRVLNDGIEKYLEISKEIEDRNKQTTIKGIIAQKGTVKGKVKIVQSYHDIKNVNEGDILVANTTHPNYLPGMQKASAFVTNEGGIISHAAIVAREMKKPCIVGTKIATSLLKDGDLVEVDADKGTVKIIKTN